MEIMSFDWAFLDGLCGLIAEAGESMDIFVRVVCLIGIQG
jgi:hypothetical protein